MPPKAHVKSPKQAWDDLTWELENYNTVDATKVSETLRAIALSPAIRQLDSLRSFLLEKNLYSYEVYFSELANLREVKKPHMAVSLFDWRQEHLSEPVTHAELLEIILTHKGQDKSALTSLVRFFQRLCSDGHRDLLGTAGFNAILQSLTSTPSVSIGDSHLLQIFDELIKEAPSMVNAATYVLVMRGLRDLKNSSDWFNRARSDGFQTVSLNEVFLRRLISRGKADEALEIYRELVASGDSKLVSTGLLAIVLEHCTTTGDLAGTREVFDGSTALGINPTTKMFALLIDLCAVVKNVDMAHSIVSRDLPRHGLEIDRLIYNSLVALYCAVDDMEHAEGVVQEMTQRRPSDVQENTIIPLFSKYLELYRTSKDASYEEKAQKHWQTLARSQHRIPLRIIAEASVRLRDMKLVGKILRQAPQLMHSRETLENLWKTIVRFENVRPERRLKLFSALTRQSTFIPTSAHFDYLIKEMASAGKLARCFDLALEVIEIWSRKHLTRQNPPRLTFCSHSLFLPPRSTLPFELTSTHAKDFVENVVLPNQLAIPDAPFPNDESVIWSEQHVEQWRKQLNRWQTAAVNDGLL